MAVLVDEVGAARHDKDGHDTGHCSSAAAGSSIDPTGTILRQTGSMSQADWEQLSIWQTRNRSGAIDTSQRMELPIAPTTGTTSVVDHDVIIITDSDSDDSD
jgi:hypothetical protein